MTKLTSTITAAAAATTAAAGGGANNSGSVERFQAYLRCKTAHPNPDFTSTLCFLKTMADELQLKYEVHTFVENQPIVVLTWEGKGKEEPLSSSSSSSIVFNSHMDVVPVENQLHWSTDPFGGIMKNGKIYGRGAQDMKSVGCQYLEAVRELQLVGYQPNHTFHFTFMPDEEVGGKDGMARFVQSDRWVSMQPKFVLDEGMASPNDDFLLFYGERAPWWIEVKVNGTTGHGSQYVENTAGPKLHRIMTRIEAFRQDQQQLLKQGKHPDGSHYTLGDVTTINVTMLHGGIQYNVLPEHLVMALDVRIPPSVDLVLFKATLEGWCFCEEGVEIRYPQFTANNPTTPLHVPWQTALCQAARQLAIPLTPRIFPASTDARYVRACGVPALGVSPMRRTEPRMHAVDECLEEAVFMEGIRFYVEVVKALDLVE